MQSEQSKALQKFRVVVRCERTGKYLRTEPDQDWDSKPSSAHMFWSVQDAFRACHDRQLADVHLIVHHDPLPPFILPLPAARLTA